MSVARFCPVWACRGGIFSSDPVTMETGYIGHGKEFIPNFSALALDKQLVVFLFFVFFSFLCMTSNVLFLAAHQVP